MSPARPAGGRPLRLAGAGRLGHVASGAFQQLWPPTEQAPPTAAATDTYDAATYDAATYS